MFNTRTFKIFCLFIFILSIIFLIGIFKENTIKLNLRKIIDDIKNLAVSRLILDNFNHIKAFWIQLGVKLSQVSLHFGVDDLDGTVMEEHITHDAGAQTGQALLKDEIVKMIKEAGRIPVQRDTLYNVVKIWE